jgi:hypothetical protein
MSIFDYLKRISDSFFDGLSSNAVDHQLKKSKKDSISRKKHEEDIELEKILSQIPMPMPPEGEVDEEERERIRKHNINAMNSPRMKEIDANNKRIRRLEEQYGVELANKIYLEELGIGMNINHVREIKGKEDKRIENITGGKEIIKLYYGKKKNKLGNESYNFEITLTYGLVSGWKDISYIGKRK